MNSHVFRMHRAIPAHSGKGSNADVFFEFNFFDGVMVDCKEVNNAEWGPWQSRLNPSSKVWDVSGLDELYNAKKSATGRELRESNGLNMETRHEWRKDWQMSPKRGGENSDNVNAANAANILWPGSADNSSVSSGKDPTIKKKVQFLNGENNFPWTQHSAVFSGNPELSSASRMSMGSSAVTDTSLQCGHNDIDNVSSKKSFCEGHDSNLRTHVSGTKHAFGDNATWDPVSLSTGHLDWLWSEEAERQDHTYVLQGEGSTLAASSDRPNAVGKSSSNCMEREPECDLPFSIGEEATCLDDPVPVINSWHKFKFLGSDHGKTASGGWASFVGGDSARCSSMSLTDLVETSPRKNSREIRRERSTLASHLQLAGSSLASQFFTKEAEVDCLWPFSPAHSSLSTSSASRRNVLGTKVEPKRLSINDPIPNGSLHGLLHCTLLAGLPNYTFLLDDYDEAVTAKIWMEDIVLGEQQGAWRYTFYSLKGDSRRKGRNGWKHWKKKEKLASEVVGSMRVSSVLCSEAGVNGDENLSVESEFVLLSTRTQDPSHHVHADVSSQTSSSSLETGSHGCNKLASHAIINAASSPSQSRASSSDGGLSEVSSPGAISAWYVAQSLIPSSLGSPDIMADGKQKSRKWSLHSGLSGMRIGKAKRRSQLSPNISAPNSNASMEEVCPEGTCSSAQQTHAELAAMIINVPLELPDRVAEPVPGSDSSLTPESQLQEHGVGAYRISRERSVDCAAHLAADHSHSTKHKVYNQNRQAKITVILPSGNHGRPLSDMRGPSPLIKRWKEGGRCDCKGWDLGCGLLVLKNEHPAVECLKPSSTKGMEYRAHSNKALTLYRQDATELEESYISLAPQENGLIAVDFRAPLSPLQAFAMAVAILHGRGSSVPDSEISREMTTAINLEMQSSLMKTTCQGYRVMEQDVGDTNPGYRNSIDGKRMNGHMYFTRQQTCGADGNNGRACNKTQGTEVFGCGSELALSFERV